MVESTRPGRPPTTALVQLENATVSGNTADAEAGAGGGGDGGGINARGTGGSMTLYNTIVAGNADLTRPAPWRRIAPAPSPPAATT